MVGGVATKASGGSSRPTGPPRGGPGGPCDHCARTSSPCWRKGPPEKPLLCNACGAHYLVKKSLDGYRPGQKPSRSPGSGSAPRRPKKAKGGDSNDSPRLAGGRDGDGVTSSPSGDTSVKRQRRASKRYVDDEDEGAGSDLEAKKPRSLNLKNLRRQDSDVTIADTPMAVNLLADMADRRKKQAPPPVWELTSPRGIEGARQRTFNALVGSLPTSGTHKRPPVAPDVAHQPTKRTIASLSGPCKEEDAQQDVKQPPPAGLNDSTATASAVWDGSTPQPFKSLAVAAGLVGTHNTDSWNAQRSCAPGAASSLPELLLGHSIDDALIDPSVFHSSPFISSKDNFQAKMIPGSSTATSQEIHQR